MLLRKSPKRTPALLAANRTNARKSTGPRTPAGKRRSSWNAVSHGLRMRASSRSIPFATREAEAFEEFYFTLRDAIMPAAENVPGERALVLTAVRAWRVKCLLDRWMKAQTEEDWLVLAAGAAALPNLWRLRIKRPGISVQDWTVTISVWLRWGRGSGRSRHSTTEDGGKADRPRMHTMVSVHTAGHPCSTGVLETQRTKPEYERNQSGSENISVSGGREAASAAANQHEAQAAGEVTGTSKRSKPECGRKENAYRNMSRIGSSPERRPNGSGQVPRFGKVFGSTSTALTSRKQRPEFQLVQTKPEYLRKKSAYKNVSKVLGWLRACVSHLLKRRRRKPALGARHA